ncbi:Alpha/Beta hydrolase protein [Vararia minispora EC-137]|uniref:Alpha/Beta hydrolase protein n=1 Tax=Vararia minispora EC-137 TaxID=1314806 RepID=A0ACB8QVQ2_9AGAM|nr:Alpha/Beta hydrolase protein [Vararia minispora EC-137]
MATSPYKEEFLPGPPSNPAITLYTRTYSPVAPESVKAALVFVHGFIEHIGRFTNTHNRWANNGFGVFAFDGRGFGRTALEPDGRPRKGRGDGMYGRASDTEQMRDVSWAIECAREKWPGVPVFLMGHSMGGAIALAYISRPADPKTARHLAGVIISSPLIALTHPPFFVTRWAGGLVGRVFPNFPLNAPVDGKSLSHDASVGKAFASDPMVRAHVTVGIVDAMLSRGEELSHAKTISWPDDLPLLVVHGDNDEVCSVTATKVCFSKINVKDKILSIYPDGYHELHNEPSGVAEKFADECITWSTKRIPKTTSSPSPPNISHPKL